MRAIELVDIVGFEHLEKVAGQIFQFFVILIINELEYGNSVIDLESEAVEKVVDNHHVLQFAVLDYPQVFNEEPVLGLHTVLPGEDVADIFMLGVDVVHDGVRVLLR